MNDTIKWLQKEILIKWSFIFLVTKDDIYKYRRSTGYVIRYYYSPFIVNNFTDAELKELDDTMHEAVKQGYIQGPFKEPLQKNPRYFEEWKNQRIPTLLNKL